MKLTKSKIKALKPGKHGDGRNLWLFVTPSGAATWAFLYTFGGKRREKWLKPYESMSIEQARDEAVRLRSMIREGRDPLEEESKKAAPKRLNTFEAVAERAVASFVEGMTNKKAKDQWMSTLRTYAFPLIGSKDVSVSIGVQKGPPIGVQKGPPSSSGVKGMAGVPFALVAA